MHYKELWMRIKSVWWNVLTSFLHHCWRCHDWSFLTHVAGTHVLEAVLGAGYSKTDNVSAIIEVVFWYGTNRSKLTNDVSSVRAKTVVCLVHCYTMVPEIQSRQISLSEISGYNFRDMLGRSTIRGENDKSWTDQGTVSHHCQAHWPCPLWGLVSAWTIMPT